MSKLKQGFLIVLSCLVITLIAFFPAEPSFAVNDCIGKDCIQNELIAQEVLPAKQPFDEFLTQETPPVKRLSVPNGCPGRDCIHHELRTQAVCRLQGSDKSPLQPTGRTPGWYKGLNTEIDNKILGGNIVAYKIRWFNGSWSHWYVTGVNDIDHKFNTNSNDMRRLWSYFTDHQHQYILCK